MIIRNGRIDSAGCILPLTSKTVSAELGTRHRAAIGLSESCDALAVVVSEETGAISVAKGGEIRRDLKSAELTAKWEQELALIAEGKADSAIFIGRMRKYASSLVSSVITDSSVYRHDNMTREKCPQCGKYMLDVNGKKGRMLICQDRECGYRKSLSVITNARCPECHKKLEMRGEGDKRAFYCVCGFREKLSDFDKRKQESGAGKRDIAKYMNSKDNKKPASNPLADQLAKWMEENS